MTTVHANNARDGLARIEVLVMMAGFDIPIRALRQQVASAVQLSVQARRVTGGRRKVVSISEITGMEGDSIQMHDLFGVGAYSELTPMAMRSGDLSPRESGPRLPRELKRAAFVCRRTCSHAG